jgi:hypothetical protein
MIDEEYKKLKLERKLVEDFIDDFYKKIGYRPVIITKVSSDSELEVMPLAELKACLTPFLPTYYGKKLSLEHKSRTNEIVELRHMYFHLARSMGYKLTAIAYSIGKLDHTTVIHGLKTFANLMEVDPRYRLKFQTIFNHIKNIKNESSAMADSNKVQDNA